MKHLQKQTLMKKKKHFKSQEVLPVTRFMKPKALSIRKPVKYKARTKCSLVTGFALHASPEKRKRLPPKLKNLANWKKVSPPLLPRFPVEEEEDSHDDEERNQEEEEFQNNEENLEFNQEGSSSDFEEREADTSEEEEEESSSQGSPIKKRALESYNFKKMHVFSLGPKNLALVVLKHPNKVVFSGSFLVRALVGSVEVNGFQLTPDWPDFVPLFSSPDLGLFPIITQAPHHQDGFLLLSSALASLDAHYLISSIKEVFTNKSVLLALRRPMSTSGSNYAADLMKVPFYSTPSTISIPPLDRLRIRLQEKGDGSKIIRLLPSQKEVVSELTSSMTLLASKGTLPIVLVCGPHNVGKSTFLCHLINTFLQKFPSVYHLDLDPLHPEFTPPGSVSLTKVSSPLLGPSFTHLKQPEKSVFLGQMNIGKIGPTYHAAMLALINHYNHNYLGHVPLFINTMDCSSGLGHQFLIDITRYSRPTHVIQFVIPDDTGDTDFQTQPMLTAPFLVEARGWGSDNFKYNQTFTHHKVCSRYFADSAPLSQKQTLSICSYIGQLQRTTVPRPIAELNSYCVPWDSLAVCFCNDVVSDSQIFHVLNASFVALCIVDNELLESALPPDTEFPAIISGSPINECLGFGLINRIDLSRKAFHIITPEPLFCLSMVNSIFHGKIMIPEEIFAEQDGDGDLPYLSTSASSPDHLTTLFSLVGKGRQ